MILTNIDWDELLDLKKNGVGYSTNSFLRILTENIEKYAAIKAKSNKTLTLNYKPWISRAIKIKTRYINNIVRRNTQQKKNFYMNRLKDTGTKYLC